MVRVGSLLDLMESANSAVRRFFVSVTASLGPSLLTATVATHYAQSDPHQCPKCRGNQRIKPQRPREVPHEEVEPDSLGVLQDEDEQQATPGERGDGSTAESCSATATWFRFRHLVHPFGLGLGCGHPTTLPTRTRRSCFTGQQPGMTETGSPAQRPDAQANGSAGPTNWAGGAGRTQTGSRAADPNSTGSGHPHDICSLRVGLCVKLRSPVSG